MSEVKVQCCSTFSLFPPTLTFRALRRLPVLLDMLCDRLLRVDALLRPRLRCFRPVAPQEDNQGQGQAEEQQQQAHGQQGVHQQGGVIQAHQHRGTRSERRDQVCFSCQRSRRSWDTETAAAAALGLFLRNYVKTTLLQRFKEKNKIPIPIPHQTTVLKHSMFFSLLSKCFTPRCKHSNF